MDGSWWEVCLMGRGKKLPPNSLTRWRCILATFRLIITPYPDTINLPPSILVVLPYSRYALLASADGVYLECQQALTFNLEKRLCNKQTYFYNYHHRGAPKSSVRMALFLVTVKYLMEWWGYLAWVGLLFMIILPSTDWELVLCLDSSLCLMWNRDLVSNRAHLHGARNSSAFNEQNSQKSLAL